MTDGTHEASDIHSRHVLPLYARIDELEAQLREAKAQTYCQICGSILGDGRWQMTDKQKRDSDMDALIHVVTDLHWMARRYVSGRSSYAPSLFNRHVRTLLGLGIKLNPTADGTVWAQDGMGRRYDRLSDEQSAEVMRADARVDDLDQEIGMLRAERDGYTRAMRLAIQYAREREESSAYLSVVVEILEAALRTEADAAAYDLERPHA